MRNKDTMGTMRFRAIVVTGFDTFVDEAWLVANEVYGDSFLTEPTQSLFNSITSFMVVPTGLKLSLQSREEANKQKFIRWLKGFLNERGFSKVNWAYVQYGDEDKGEARVLDSSDEVDRLVSICLPKR